MFFITFFTVFASFYANFGNANNTCYKAGQILSHNGFGGAQTLILNGGSGNCFAVVMATKPFYDTCIYGNRSTLNLQDGNRENLEKEWKKAGGAIFSKYNNDDKSKWYVGSQTNDECQVYSIQDERITISTVKCQEEHFYICQYKFNYNCAYRKFAPDITDLSTMTYVIDWQMPSDYRHDAKCQTEPMSEPIPAALSKCNPAGFTEWSQWSSCSATCTQTTGAPPVYTRFQTLDENCRKISTSLKSVKLYENVTCNTHVNCQGFNQQTTFSTRDPDDPFNKPVPNSSEKENSFQLTILIPVVAVLVVVGLITIVVISVVCVRKRREKKRQQNMAKLFSTEEFQSAEKSNKPKKPLKARKELKKREKNAPTAHIYLSPEWSASTKVDKSKTVSRSRAGSSEGKFSKTSKQAKVRQDENYILIGPKKSKSVATAKAVSKMSTARTTTAKSEAQTKGSKIKKKKST